MEEPDGPSHLVLLEWDPQEPQKSTGYLFFKAGPDVRAVPNRIEENGVLEPLANDFSLLGKVVKVEREEPLKPKTPPEEGTEKESKKNDEDLTFKEMVF